MGFWLLPMTQQLLDSEEIVTELDISHIVIEDDTPMDNFQSEKQQRLLVEPLYSSCRLVSLSSRQRTLAYFTDSSLTRLYRMPF